MQEEVITIVVQVNRKLRGHVEVPNQRIVNTI